MTQAQRVHAAHLLAAAAGGATVGFLAGVALMVSLLR